MIVIAIFPIQVHFRMYYVQVVLILFMCHVLQLRAPGCIVIVVGTHLDSVKLEEASKLEESVKTMYRDTKIYPRVVGCISVSCVNTFRNNIDALRQFIYDRVMPEWNVEE